MAEEVTDLLDASRHIRNERMKVNHKKCSHIYAEPKFVVQHDIVAWSASCWTIKSKPILQGTL
jgi:hypothetical protein